MSAYGNDDRLCRIATIVQMIGVIITFGLPVSDCARRAGFCRGGRRSRDRGIEHTIRVLKPTAEATGRDQPPA
jgi:hypothetical protein